MGCVTLPSSSGWLPSHAGRISAPSTACYRPLSAARPCMRWPSQQMTPDAQRLDIIQASRRRNVPRAAATQDLWSYGGSNVAPMELEQLQLLHRMSFSRRNPRSYVVILHDPKAASTELEFEVERLAGGLSYTPTVAVLSLAVTDRETATFAKRILQVESLPAVLLYPRGAPGLLRYCGRSITAEGLLKAINTCRRRVNADAEPFELRGVGPPMTMLQQEASSGAGDAAVAATAQAGAVTEATATAGAASSGAAAAKTGAAVLVATTQQQPLDSYTGYWTSDKVRWWAVVGVLSVLAFTYERWIDPLMDQVALLKRLGARQLGKQYDEDQTADDITTVLLMQQVQRLEAGQKLGAPTEVELRGEDGQWTSGGATGGMPGGMPGAMPGGGSGSSSSSPGMGMGSSSGAGGSRGSSGS